MNCPKQSTVYAAEMPQLSLIIILRALLPNVNMLVLSATANKNLEKKIVKFLSMQSFTVIRTSPNRLNIHFEKVKCPKLQPILTRMDSRMFKKREKEF